MTPSIGRSDPTWAKVLLIDTGNETFCFVTIDAIGAESSVRELAYEKILAMGINITETNFLLHGSHTHSGTYELIDAFRGCESRKVCF